MNCTKGKTTITWIKYVGILICIFLLFYDFLFSDGIAYGDKKSIIVENEHFIVIHYHDWSSDPENKKYKMMITHQNPINKENDYAYILCIQKSSGKIQFKIPSPALTHLFLMKDGEYIIGLSNIKLNNPIQLLILNKKGKVLYKRHIGKYEAVLTLSEFEQFSNKYSIQKRKLKSLNRIEIIENKVFIDITGGAMTNILGEDCFYYLIKKRRLSHLSKNIGESVTNFVFWFMEKDPEIKLKCKGEKLIAISLLDREGERFEIPINEKILK